ncbi:RNA-binding protein cabeza-like [Physella acuta]|uniref:RNA-binding protein cabeza-like n=1 Tax=Physella acuta TaxID=109671 RepID=UPI0027DE95BD|nr:RNA-binding protein cabeza-like [Physella acuta]
MSFSGSFGGGRGGGVSSTTMMVESSNVGKIIGLVGSKIRDLEQDSNARIKISRYEDGMKSVEISGTTEEIENAKRLIEECLSGGSRGGGGGGRGFGGDGGGGDGRGFGRDDGGGDGRGF